MERVSGARLVVKLHPHGAGKEQAYELAMRGRFHSVITTRDLPLLDLIAIADCVVVYSSSAGFEAVAMASARPRLRVGLSL